MATATMRIGAAWRMTFRMLPSVMNVSVVAAKKTTQARKKKAIDRTWAFSDRKSAAGEPFARSV
ncbi:hypothetical protein D9M68_445400 [compost metagenome]